MQLLKHIFLLLIYIITGTTFKIRDLLNNNALCCEMIILRSFKKSDCQFNNKKLDVKIFNKFIFFYLCSVLKCETIQGMAEQM